MDRTIFGKLFLGGCGGGGGGSSSLLFLFNLLVCSCRFWSYLLHLTAFLTIVFFIYLCISYNLFRFRISNV